MKYWIVFLLLPTIFASCKVSTEPGDIEVEKIVRESYKPYEFLGKPMGSAPSINSLLILDKKRKNRNSFKVVSVVKGTFKWIELDFRGMQTSYFIDTIKFEMYRSKGDWADRNVVKKSKIMNDPFMYINDALRVNRIKE
jgi:hypothetical protein